MVWCKKLSHQGGLSMLNQKRIYYNKGMLYGVHGQSYFTFHAKNVTKWAIYIS